MIAQMFFVESSKCTCLPQFPQAFTIVKLLIVSLLLLFCIVTTPIVTCVCVYQKTISSNSQIT